MGNMQDLHENSALPVDKRLASVDFPLCTLPIITILGAEPPKISVK